MNEWNIQSRGHACEACGKGFTDQEHFHTLLLDEKQGFKRADVCEDCWQKQYSEGARERKGFISYWHGVYHVPPPVTEVLQKDTAETLLRKLIELNDPTYIPAAYILGAMLERKRILRVKEQVKRDKQRYFVYEQVKTGDVFTILDPDLHLDQLEQVQRDVGFLLEHGLNVAAAAPAVVSQETVAVAEPVAPALNEVEGEAVVEKASVNSMTSAGEIAPV